MNTPCCLHHWHAYSHSEPQFPPPSPGDAPRPVGRSGSASYGVTALPCVPGGMRHCVHLPKVTCLFPPVLRSSYYKALLACQVNSSGGSSFWCQTPRLGSLLWGLKFSFLFENFCDVIIFPPVCGSPTWRDVGFDYIMTSPLLPSHCGFFFMSLDVEYFGTVFSLFIDGCSAVSCDFGVFVRSELKSSCSATLSRNSSHFLKNLQWGLPGKWLRLHTSS